MILGYYKSTNVTIVNTKKKLLLVPSLPSLTKTGLKRYVHCSQNTVQGFHWNLKRWYPTISNQKRQKLMFWKKLLMAPEWGISHQIGPKTFYALFSKQNVRTFLKFFMMIGHYELIKVVIANTLKNSYCLQISPLQYSLLLHP